MSVPPSHGLSPMSSKDDASVTLNPPNRSFIVDLSQRSNTHALDSAQTSLTHLGEHDDEYSSFSQGDVPPTVSELCNETPPPANVTLSDTEEPRPTQRQQPAIEPVVPQSPQTHLSFLLVSGRRKNMSFDPEYTIGRVKELVWNAWPSGKCIIEVLFHYPLQPPPPRLPGVSPRGIPTFLSDEWSSSITIALLFLCLNRLDGRTTSIPIISPHTFHGKDVTR